MPDKMIFVWDYVGPRWIYGIHDLDDYQPDTEDEPF